MDARDADLPRQIAAPVHDRHCPFVMTADGEERAKRSEKRGERDARSPRSLLTPLHSLLVCGNDRNGQNLRIRNVRTSQFPRTREGWGWAMPQRRFISASITIKAVIIHVTSIGSFWLR